MSESKNQQLRQQLLARRVAGEITREEYDELLAEIIRHESIAGAETTSQLSATESDRYQSVGDLPTVQPGTRNIQPGLQLDNYLLEKRLGRGGMGEVWKARDSVGERDVVVKLLPPELTRNSDEMRRVKESFQRVHELNHQNICPTYGLGHHDDAGYFLVMKFLRGGTLAWYRNAFFKKFNRFPLKEVVRVLKPVAQALDYAHQQKVVHRDIKPENIMISRDGKQIHVVDFGLAAEIRSSMVRVSHVQMDTSGTYPYMAPEQWKGQLQDARTDQYALAVVAYELITGRLPFEGDRFILERCVLKQPFPMIENASETVNRALASATAKTRNQRFGSCSEFISALLKSPESKTTSTKLSQAKSSAVNKPAPALLENSKMRMIRISTGEFMMGRGSGRDLEPTEPQQRVRIRNPFYLGATTVTQAQWEAVMGNRPWKGKENVMEGPNYPATYVSWDDAVEFCERLSKIEGDLYRLPTEAEWEFACRAGTTTMYSFGNHETMMGSYAWFDENINPDAKYAHEVGQKRPNPWGLFDMHGNVWEWCNDDKGSQRVGRGGSWDFPASFGRSTDTNTVSPYYRSDDFGFRVARGPINQSTPASG